MLKGHNGNAPILLREFIDIDLLTMMGIAKVEPGKYDTACGKGYFPCSQTGDPEVLDLKLPAINLFQYEGASSFWYWDRSYETFIEVPISD